MLDKLSCTNLAIWLGEDAPVLPRPFWLPFTARVVAWIVEVDLHPILTVSGGVDEAEVLLVLRVPVALGSRRHDEPV